jgi:hypothetical protein
VVALLRRIGVPLAQIRDYRARAGTGHAARRDRTLADNLIGHAAGTAGLQDGAMPVYVKRRARPAPGSITEALDSFRAEVRFYREIAPVLDIRVPACYETEGTVLVLEDLTGWEPGADPLAAARILSKMHRQWENIAQQRWPWLRPIGAAVDWWKPCSPRSGLS